MSSQDAVFLTGFPGFIASRLLLRLARDRGRRFLLLVQPAFAERAQHELVGIAQEAGRSIPDFVILPGDITQPNLGLSPADLETARSESIIVFHLAAVYDLTISRDLGLRVNVEGTRKVNAFARSLPHLRHYHYVRPVTLPENVPAASWKMNCNMTRVFATIMKRQSTWPSWR